MLFFFGDRHPKIQAIITSIFLHRSSSLFTYHPDSGVLMARQVHSLSLHNTKRNKSFRKASDLVNFRIKYELFTVLHKDLWDLVPSHILSVMSCYSAPYLLILQHHVLLSVLQTL